MNRFLLLFLLSLTYHQVIQAQNPNFSKQTWVVTQGDTLTWVSPLISLGGQLLVQQQPANGWAIGDTLRWIVPLNYHHGGVLHWQSHQGALNSLGRFLLRYEYRKDQVSNTGYWIGGTGQPDTLVNGFSMGWRALIWPPNAGHQPPINAMGKCNQWLFSDTAHIIIFDTVGGNELDGPDNMSITFSGSKETRVLHSDRCHISIQPSDTFQLVSDSFRSLHVNSAFPVQLTQSKLTIGHQLKVTQWPGALPDTIISIGNDAVSFSNLGDTLRLKNLIHYGKGQRELLGLWEIQERLLCLDSTLQVGSLVWSGSATSQLIGTTLLDKLTISRDAVLNIHNPIKLKRSNQPLQTQLHLQSGSILMADSFGFQWEGSALGFGQIILDSNVQIKLNRISLRQLFPSGSRLKLVHNGHWDLKLNDGSQGVLEWPDSAWRRVRKLHLGIGSTWEIGSTFSRTELQSQLEIADGAHLIMPNGRFIQLNPQALAQVEGQLSCQDAGGLLGTLQGSLRGLPSQIQFSDSARVCYNGGTQSISPLPSYPELILENTGVKSLIESLTIRGSLRIRGSYTRLDADTFSLSIGKNMEVRTTSGNGFSEGQSTLIFNHPNAVLEVSGFQQTEIVSKIIINSGCNLLLKNNLQIKSGGRLQIHPSGTLDADTFELTGGGTLRLLHGSTLILKKTQSLLPGLSGTSSTYQIDSSAIIFLEGQGPQLLRGGRTYGHLVFGGSGEKKLSSALSRAPSAITIRPNVTFNTQQLRYADEKTDLAMDSLAILQLGGSNIQPEAGGSWQIHPRSKIIFQPSTLAGSIIRGKQRYPHIVIQGGLVQIKAQDTIGFVDSSGHLVIDSLGSFQIADSSACITLSTGPKLHVLGTITCYHKGGLSGFIQAANPTSALQWSGRGTMHYAGIQSSQFVDSLSFYHLKLSGRSLKLMPRRLTVLGNLENVNSTYTLPDSIFLLGPDTQRIKLGLAKHISISGSIKILAQSLRLNGDLCLYQGAQLKGSHSDTLVLESKGQIWTNDSTAVNLPIRWTYQHPFQQAGWRLAGFPWAMSTANFRNHFNPLDTINPNLKAMTWGTPIIKWKSLIQNQLNTDTLFPSISNAWMIRCGNNGILRSALDSINLTGMQLPTQRIAIDTGIGWRLLANPLLQDLAWGNANQVQSSGLQKALWRWGGLNHPGWMLESEPFQLIDGSNPQTFNYLSIGQAAAIYRKQSGNLAIYSLSQRSNTANSSNFRTQFQTQHHIELQIRVGNRIRQWLGFKSTDVTSPDTFLIPPFPEGDLIGLLSPIHNAQALVVNRLNNAFALPLYIQSTQSDTIKIDLNIRTLEGGWQVLLIDSSNQQGYTASNTLVKSVNANQLNRFSLYFFQQPTQVSNNNESVPYIQMKNRIVLTEAVDELEFWNITGQRLGTFKTISLPFEVELPKANCIIINIKKGEKRWFNTVFRLE